MVTWWSSQRRLVRTGLCKFSAWKWTVLCYLGELKDPLTGHIQPSQGNEWATLIQNRCSFFEYDVGIVVISWGSRLSSCCHHNRFETQRGGATKRSTATLVFLVPLRFSLQPLRCSCSNSAKMMENFWLLGVVGRDGWWLFCGRCQTTSSSLDVRTNFLEWYEIDPFMLCHLIFSLWSGLVVSLPRLVWHLFLKLVEWDCCQGKLPLTVSLISTFPSSGQS